MYECLCIYIYIYILRFPYIYPGQEDAIGNHFMMLQEDTHSHPTTHKSAYAILREKLIHAMSPYMKKMMMGNESPSTIPIPIRNRARNILTKLSLESSYQ